MIMSIAAADARRLQHHAPATAGIKCKPGTPERQTARNRKNRMATLSVFIADENLQDVLDAFCDTYHYQDRMSNNAPNPETKTVFAERQLARFVKEVYAGQKSQRASERARGEAASAADSVIITSATQIGAIKPGA